MAPTRHIIYGRMTADNSRINFLFRTNVMPLCDRRRILFLSTSWPGLQDDVSSVPWNRSSLEGFPDTLQAIGWIGGFCWGDELLCCGAGAEGCPTEEVGEGGLLAVSVEVCTKVVKSRVEPWGLLLICPVRPFVVRWQWQRHVERHKNNEVSVNEESINKLRFRVRSPWNIWGDLKLKGPSERL